MYQMTENHGKYQTYTMTDTVAGSSFTVNPGRGGIITAFTAMGRDVLYMNDSIYADPSKYIRGGVPILFPTVGKLTDDVYEIDGRQYSIPIHGLVRNYPWEIRSNKVDECAQVVVGIKSNDDTLKKYPFNFDLEFTYTLKGNKLTIAQKYTNLSDKEMPVVYGFHPYFKVSNKKNANIELQATHYKDFTNGHMEAYTGTIDFSAQTETARLFENNHQNSVLLDTGEGDRRTRVTFDSSYKYILIWSLLAEDFVCIEPWTAEPDALNTMKDLISIEAGQSQEATMEITAE